MKKNGSCNLLNFFLIALDRYRNPKTNCIKNFWVVHITLLIWSGFLVLHFILFLILRRRTIKGVHRSDIFE